MTETDLEYLTDAEFLAHLARCCEQAAALWTFLDAMEDA